MEEPSESSESPEPSRPRGRRRARLDPSRRFAYGVASAFTFLFTLFLTPATSRGEEERPQDPEPRNSREGSFDSHRNLHRLVLSLTLLFVTVSLFVSSSLVVYTAWIHDLKNGAFALVFAVLSAQVALNWLLWRDGEDYEEERA